MVDIENTHWQMLEYSSQSLGHILADGSEETNNEELERIWKELFLRDQKFSVGTENNYC